MAPSLNGPCNGRKPNGRFTKGNKLGRGNPHGRRVNELRAVLFDAVTPAEFRKAVAAVVKKAVAGDAACFRELCDRLFGKPAPHDLTARIEALEQRLLGDVE